MVQSKTPLLINPGKGLGFLCKVMAFIIPVLSTDIWSSVLGASLHDLLSRIKAQPHLYPIIDLSFSAAEPLASPVLLNLPQNGIRLRFDGPDQRLRLIEVLDFSGTPLIYKGLDLVKPQENQPSQRRDHKRNNTYGPAFRQVYHKLFGPTFSGEYLPPTNRSQSSTGTYVLSYPGVAFSFPLEHSAWSTEVDFVSLLSSSAALAARSLSIFNGSSWPDARVDLFTRSCPHPRSLSLTGRGRECSPDEIEMIKICGSGRVDMMRRSSPPFHLVFSETTPQDLVTELGPPDAIYQKVDRRLSIHKTRTRSRSDQNDMRPHSISPASFDGISDTERSSGRTDMDESDEDLSTADDKDWSTECFYNYFHHGFDIFMSYPSSPSPSLNPSQSPPEYASQLSSTSHIVATKLLLHANVPGSFPFNRYRRSRWILDPEQVTNGGTPITSETPFCELAPVLRQIWEHTYTTKEEKDDLQKPMVLNRGWGDSPGSSCELAGGPEDSVNMPRKNTASGAIENESSLGNTNLYGFPGLLFEVLKNDAVSCLTVY